MRGLIFAVCLVVMGGCVGPVASSVDASTLDASALAECEVTEIECDCLDVAWDLHNWSMVLSDGIAAGDLSLADVEWISAQMDYHAGVFRVCTGS